MTNIENISLPPNTHFPDDCSVFPGELLNHWTIDEYIPEVGYNGYTLEKLIVEGVKQTLPSSLG